MDEDPYKILDRDFAALSDTEKLVVWKIRKWMPYSTGWYPSKPPTPDSIRKIEKHFGLSVPPIYVELARLAPNYGVWFGSIGPDFESHNHIIRLNAAFRSGDEEYAALPPEFVMINHGHDGHCDCWKLSEIVGVEHPIYHINVETRSDPKLLANSFLEYWSGHV